MINNAVNSIIGRNINLWCIAQLSYEIIKTLKKTKFN